ncbi:MAG: YceI family protein [Bacteroidales bacterium]
MIHTLISILLLNILAPNPSGLISYTINSNSILTLTGSSNINKFECTTNTIITNGNILLEQDNAEQSILFSNAKLKLEIKTFDCKNPLLNKDFYSTLNAEKSPYIEIELLNATPIKNNKTINTIEGNFKAKVAITLNGKCQYDEIIVSWQKIENNTFRFLGTKQLLMSDFGINAPVMALGLIRVNKEILIHFDLYIQTNYKTTEQASSNN